MSPDTQEISPRKTISTELVSVGSQLASYPASTSQDDFHRARLGGITTGQLPSIHFPRRFPPSSSRWDHNWPATQHPLRKTISTELASVGSQLASYPASTSQDDFHRARLGGITTGQLPSIHFARRFPPSSPRWDHNWPATQHPLPKTISTELASVGSQLASYPASTSQDDFHRARLGGITTGQLPSIHFARRFPPSSSRWDHNWPATQHPLRKTISTELVSVGSQLASYPAPHNCTLFNSLEINRRLPGCISCNVLLSIQLEPDLGIESSHPLADKLNAACGRNQTGNSKS